MTAPIEPRPGMWCNRPRQTVTVKLPSGRKVTGVVRVWLGDRRVEIQTGSEGRVVGRMEPGS